ncbi:helix-turn-helix domain-containing protein [Methylomarinum roseum]|uniref:helix-turn-helix domain-containing protein n=1 Tax=Methylomarinum roseum TaxID=3067653 RepID=UPI003D7E8D53
MLIDPPGTLRVLVEIFQIGRFRFCPTCDQIKLLNREFDHARFVWNHCLELRGKAYRRRGESINYVGLGKRRISNRPLGSTF